MTIRVLIAEDEVAVRAALSELISAEEGFQLVGSAGDAEEAISVAAQVLPDVALVDVKMPGGGGQRAAREIRSTSPETRVIALSAYDDRGTVFEMLRAGASGYLVKGVPAGEILETIRRAMRGQGALSAQVTADVIDELAGQLERQEQAMQGHRERVERIRRALVPGVMTIVFQPIFELSTLAVVGAEALSRFSIDPRRSPDLWFREAGEVGLGVELELAAIRSALDHLDRLPKDTRAEARARRARSVPMPRVSVTSSLITSGARRRMCRRLAYPEPASSMARRAPRPRMRWRAGSSAS